MTDDDGTLDMSERRTGVGADQRKDSHRASRSEWYYPGRIQLAKPLQELPPHIMDLLARADRFSRLPAIAQQIWDGVLTRRERECLGNDLKAAFKMKGSAANFLITVRPIWGWSALVEIAERLHLFSENELEELRHEVAQVDPVIIEYPPPSTRDGAADPVDWHEKLTSLAATRHLLLATGRLCRRLCWQGSWIEVEWTRHAKLWEFLGALVRHAKGGKTVGPDDFQGAEEADMRRWKSRLCELLPFDLARQVQPHGGGLYRLHVDPDQIAVVNLPDDAMPPLE